MITLSRLDQFLQTTLDKDLLAKAVAIDSAANGRQVTGRSQVKKVALGVSLHQAHLKQAINWGADAVIYHHGFRLEFPNQVMHPVQQQRLQLIFAHHLSIYSFHYVLDTHPTLGNNAVIIDQLGATNTHLPYFDTWGFIAKYSQPITQTELASRCQKLFGHKIFSYLPNPEGKITRFGVCSGGAKLNASNFQQIANLGLQAHITGEIGESTPGWCQETGLMYFAGGHYATEVFGVQALGDTIAQHFQGQLAVKFISHPNPI